MAASTRDISECGTNHWSARNSQKPVIDSPIPVTGQSLEFLWFETKLTNLSFPQWDIQATCAVQGHGLYEGLDWLSSELSKS